MLLPQQRAEEGLDQTESLLVEWNASEEATEADRMRRERLLPMGPVHDTVVRYEAHLNRQLHQALHELEALQARRHGESAPLARVDVQGIPEK